MDNPSKEEVELLLAAVDSADRLILVTSSQLGEYVDVGGTGYPDPNKYDKRLAARYVGAVQNMRDRAWLKLIGQQGESKTYEVTAKGYDAADRIKGGTKTKT